MYADDVVVLAEDERKHEGNAEEIGRIRGEKGIDA